MTERKAWTDFNLKAKDALIGCNPNRVVEDLTRYLVAGFEEESIEGNKRGTWMSPLHAMIFTEIGFGRAVDADERGRRSSGLYLVGNGYNQFFLWNEKAKEAYEGIKREGMFEQLVR